jgi:hypothetical protein
MEDKMKRLFNLPKSVCAALAILLLAILFLLVTTSRNPLHVYLLPSHITGKVEVMFDQADAPPLQKDHNRYIYPIPASGKLKTSNSMESGPVEVYFVGEHGEPVKVSHEQLHGMGTSGGGEESGAIAHFFIGEKEQYDLYLKQQN